MDSAAAVDYKRRWNNAAKALQSYLVDGEGPQVAVFSSFYTSRLMVLTKASFLLPLFLKERLKPVAVLKDGAVRSTTRAYHEVQGALSHSVPEAEIETVSPSETAVAMVSTD